MTYNCCEGEKCMWEIEYYETAKGDVPVFDFLDSFSVKMRGKAVRDIVLLEKLGPRMTLPHSRCIENGIYELRVQVEGDTSRIFYFFFIGRKIILTNGFIKKTQKTPLGELKKARLYKSDYERRHTL
jgi:phage-related protein